MVYVPAANVLQVELRGVLNGQPVETVQYYKNTGAIASTDADDLFDWYESDFIPALVPEAAAGMSWTEIYGTDLTTSSSPTYSRILSPAVVGTGASPALPASDTCCVSFRTAGRGRSSRGRNYVPGLQEGQATGNDVGLSTINALVAAYELLLGGGGFPAQWDWVTVSRVVAGVARVAALVLPILDVLSTDITVDSQRGRLR